MLLSPGGGGAQRLLQPVSQETGALASGLSCGATAFVTREAGRHRSLNQLTGVTCNLHYSLGSTLLWVQGRRLTRAAQCLALPRLHQLLQPEVPEQSRGASHSTFTSSANTSSF